MISKRLRYEVLRRDGYACRYCGGSAPDVKLTVDHVTPTALGGTDDPANLVAACRDCNAGKSSTSPDEQLVTQVSEEALRWSEAVKAAGKQMVDQFQTDTERLTWFIEEWESWDADHYYLPDGWAASVDHWLAAGLPREILLDCLECAKRNRSVAHKNVFAYMGGAARNRIAELHKVARQVIEKGEGESDGA